ncbi:two-component system, CitB family, response regulator CitT [Evansella caseinilytica]|uniref:Two-component system, CitB family, response regulator CitT n=1 Tax=Evansella caseinilytica TaxID=1503961 RepID=A0A1H3G8Y3_9BACI|nr:response regulator [Evansella caseinilytica]SDX99782.1 two-component system, CitB family, response regulator CitT [Evansella caseinilytica]
MASMCYNVLIVEDDFRIANINKQFVEKVNGFQVVGMTNSGAETLRFLEKADFPLDLILLDVYIPDVNGLELMWDIRKSYHDMDIVMITAAQEMETIEQTFRGGIFDYIIKPVDFKRLKQTLERYVEKRKRLDNKQKMTQEELDTLRGISATPGKTPDVPLPKGIDQLTLERVISAVEERGKDGFTAAEVGKQIGASRSTARRYLEYLVSTKRVKAELIYGDVGRPERRYVAM